MENHSSFPLTFYPTTNKKDLIYYDKNHIRRLLLITKRAEICICIHSLVGGVGEGGRFVQCFEEV